MSTPQDAKSQLDALVSLISASVSTFTSEYQTAGISLPSLDDIPSSSSSSSSSVNSSAKLSEEAKARVVKAVKTIEAACAQLTATVSSPGHIILNKATAYEESACLRVVNDAKIADLLYSKPDGVHVSDLAKSTGLEEDKLSRILRLLSTTHVFQEVRPDVFANNRVSAELLSRKSGGPVVDIVTNEQLKTAAYLGDYVREENPPFQHIYGKTVMEYFTDPNSRQRREIWARGIAGWIDLAGEEGLHKVYPWTSKLSKPFKVCDVGAGNGHVMLDLVKEFESSSIQTIVQDLPPTLELSKDFWGKNYPKAVNDGRVKFVPINFFEEEPVENCDVYYMRFCLHNWSDELFVKIVSNIAAAMKKKGPECRFLMHDIVLDHPVKDVKLASIADGEPAPAPLLPNYGVSRFREYAGDLNMMVLLNAKERSLAQITGLSKQAGLVLENTYRTGDASILEFKLE